MTCEVCGRWSGADPSTGYDGGGPCSPECEVELERAAAEAACAHEWHEQPGEPPVDACSLCGATRE